MSRFLEIVKRQFVLAHVSGIPVRIDLRWLFVFALLSWLTATNLNPRYVDNFGSALILGAITSAVLFLSILLHEVAHSLVARLERIEVVEIVLHPFGGLSRFRREPDTPRAELRIAIAGPAASFILALFFALLMAGASAAGNETITLLLFFLVLWNFMIAVFNMFPGYPLDGGRVLRAYLWHRGTDINDATVIAGRLGKGIAVVLIVFGILAALFRGGLFTGLWTVLVGVFLYDAARTIIRQVRQFDDMIVEEAMELAVTVAPEMSLMRFVDTVLPIHRRTIFPVSRDRQFYGVLLLEDLKERSRETWHQTRVQDAMRPVVPEFFIETTALLTDAKILMRQNGINALAVVDDNGLLVGFIQRGRIRKRN